MTAGDHLEVPRQHGLFKHHGIDLGDNTVAHYLEGKKIICSPINDFCSGENFRVINHSYNHPEEITIQRARSRIGEQNYNLLFNNCEHFANWCKTGMHRSKQVENLFANGRNLLAESGKIISTKFLTNINIIINKGLVSNLSRQKAKELLLGISIKRKSFQSKLDCILQEMDNWIRSNKDYNNKRSSQYLHKKLILEGQTIADHLYALENLECRILALLSDENQKQ